MEDACAEAVVNMRQAPAHQHAYERRLGQQQRGLALWYLGAETK